MNVLQRSVVHSDDVHHQANLLHGWGQSYVQLDPGPFSGSVGIFRSETTRIVHENINRSVYQSGELDVHMLAFGLPVQAAGGGLICGEEATPQTVLVFSGASGFEFLSPQCFEFIGIEIDTRASSDQRLTVMMHALEEKLTWGGRRAINLTPAGAKSLKQLLVSFSEVGAQDVLPEQNTLLERSLVGQILDILDAKAPDGFGDVRRHWGTISAIRAMVTESECCPVSVAELALTLGVPRRTLQNVCQAILGMSPLQYLRALRLSEARRLLQQQCAVTEAATRFGFWHLGYFSRDYHQMFGELPSATLQRLKGASSRPH